MKPVLLTIFSFTRFLLPYERHTKGQEEKEIKRRESESGSEKVLFPERRRLYFVFKVVIIFFLFFFSRPQA